VQLAAVLGSFRHRDPGRDEGQGQGFHNSRPNNEIKADEDEFEHLTARHDWTEQTFLVRISNTVQVTALARTTLRAPLVTVCQTILVERSATIKQSPSCNRPAATKATT